MARMTPSEFAEAVGGGLLSFPVTYFNRDLSFNERGYRDHIAWLSQYDVAGLFAAGGTGEFFSLTPDEIEKVVAAAVAENAGRVPVIAGTGYGTATAKELAVSAERAGADGLLLLPIYLTETSPEGIAAHVEAVCKSTKLGVIFYQRDRSRLNEDVLEGLCARCPNLVGFKDGIGDIELMTRIYARIGDRLTYIGGLPTAETFALPYMELGVTTYSSAIFNFLPQWALGFYDAVRRRDRETVYAELRRFVLPYIAIRSRKPGYAVSIVKAGMRVIGRGAGPLRPPLTELTDAEFQELSALVNAVTDKQEAPRRRAAG